jgi:hypothetical protein
MFVKRIIQIGLTAIVASAVISVEARPKPGKDKPKQEKPEKGEKKWDREKVKQRLKVAFDKRKRQRDDAKKKGHKIRRGSAFGKLIRDDEKIKALRKEFQEATKKFRSKADGVNWKDLNEEQKEALREKLAADRKDWAQKVKSNREEVRKRIVEIKKEFANKRDKAIDENKPGE